jgi:hypothetical protein
VSSGRSDLLFDQIEIVQQPFAGGRNAPVCFCRSRQKITGFPQYLFVVSQSRQKLVWHASTGDRVRGRQAFTMLFHLLSTE